MNGVLGSLVWCGTTNLRQQLGLGWAGFKVPSNHSNDSMTSQPQPTPCAHKHTVTKPKLHMIKQRKITFQPCSAAPQHSTQKLQASCAPHTRSLKAIHGSPLPAAPARPRRTLPPPPCSQPGLEAASAAILPHLPPFPLRHPTPMNSEAAPSASPPIWRCPAAAERREAALTLRFLEICTAILSRAARRKEGLLPGGGLYQPSAASHWLGAITWVSALGSTGKVVFFALPCWGRLTLPLSARIAALPGCRQGPQSALKWLQSQF